MVKSMQQTLPANITTNSNSNNKSGIQVPTTPTTVATGITVKRRRQGSPSSLEKLESNHLQLIEGTIQEIKKTGSNGSSGSGGRRRARRNLKSPTEWSMNSSIPENAEDLSNLRQELDRAESVYSRKTADATFGDDFSSSDDEDIVMVGSFGSFLPISHSFEERKEDDPAAPLTNHFPSPLRIDHINTSIPSLPSNLPNMPNVTTPQSQSQSQLQAGGMFLQMQNSSSMLSFPQQTMETVTEGKIIGVDDDKQHPAAVTPSNKTTKQQQQQPEEESTQETSPDSNAVPHEVFIMKGSSASTSRTVVSTTTFEADIPPSSSISSRLSIGGASGLPRTPVNAREVRDWATVAEPQRHFMTTPQPVRRNSSFSLMARSPAASFLKSAQSPVHELVKKQERKRMNLKATIDSVRSRSYNIDSRVQQMQNEKDHLKREHEAEKLAHKQLVESMENKIKFLQRQHELQTEQQEGVLGMTQTHNKFLKEQLDQLQQEYERLQLHHKQERARQAEKPAALYDQIKVLEQGKKLLLEKHEQELTSKQMEYESLESRLKNLQEQLSRQEKALQEQQQDDQHKIKKLQDRLVQVETVELTIAQQKILVLQDQLENARQERQDLVSQHRAALIREDDKYATLVQQHATTAQANHEEISALNNQVSDLQGTIQRLESCRAKDQQQVQVLEQQLSDSLTHNEESTTLKMSSLASDYEKLQIAFNTVQQERDSLLVSQKEQAELQAQMKLSFLEKVARLEEECTRLRATLDQGIASQTSEIKKLRGKLDLAEKEWNAQQATNEELLARVKILETEREELLAAHEAELDKAANANVELARNLLKELAFGL
eukprot:CAMPEP_0113660612 /NCGR_PEP_ID=MMETSP0017_2-20120614/32994_1 /TAXON_ID=2856 /ORGANISM="Cylindrotheca closterium" /LENGTH=833 /DNA_ID=CAMNT_0000575261 /DNA_START=71 /DNA_END=2572 /DNA_ORIENTATION=+ /assembly_acc=CAM_ASM_000147